VPNSYQTIYVNVTLDCKFVRPFKQHILKKLFMKMYIRRPVKFKRKTVLQVDGCSSHTDGINTSFYTEISIVLALLSFTTFLTNY